MDHAYVEEHGLIEGYHQGRLPPEEEARFEEHFAGCAQCLELLVLDRGLRRGLRAVAAEEGARAAAGVGLGLLAWLARRGRGAQAGALAAAGAAGRLRAGGESARVGHGGSGLAQGVRVLA